MHPALSVIAFTSLSGAGYGLLFLLGVLMPLGLLPGGTGLALTVLATAAAFVSAGLFASTAHLGHPERAWRALSQWRSSWLSREAVAALLTFVPMAMLAIDWTGLLSLGRGVSLALLGAAAGAVWTVFSTAMIYASLKPIRQWHNAWVVPVYLLFALMSGAFLLTAIAGIFELPGRFPLWLAMAATALAWTVKWLYWRSIDRGMSLSDVGSATGLGADVRTLDPPHTEQNYLLREMGYRIARRHRLKLRRLSMLLGALLPLALLAAPAHLADGPGFGLPLTAALSLMLGVFIERWLFFAEAEHTVMLYYGA